MSSQVFIFQRLRTRSLLEPEATDPTVKITLAKVEVLAASAPLPLELAAAAAAARTAERVRTTMPVSLAALVAGRRTGQAAALVSPAWGTTAATVWTFPVVVVGRLAAVVEEPTQMATMEQPATAVRVERASLTLTQDRRLRMRAAAVLDHLAARLAAEVPVVAETEQITTLRRRRQARTLAVEVAAAVGPAILAATVATAAAASSLLE